MSGQRVAVIGAGVAGLAAAHALVREAPRVDVVVLERRRRVGGLIETERAPEGFLVEHGADCLVTTKPWGIEAVRVLGLEADVVTGPEPRRSFLVERGRLAPIPGIFAGPTIAAVTALMRTSLLSVGAKARLALEPFIPRDAGREDESVASFLDRRFGREMRTRLLAPLLGGIYGGDADAASAETYIPRLRALERLHGSVALGMRHALRARRRLSPEARLPVMVSLRAGMGSLPDAFARHLGRRVILGVDVEGLERLSGGRHRLITTSGPVDCDAVIVAVPAWRAATLLEPLDADLAAALEDVGHQALDCVTMGWDVADVPHPLDGTGFVTPDTDMRLTRACTWASRKWPDRAPPGRVLLRSVLAHSAASDDDVVASARADLRDLLGIVRPPTFVRLRRLPHATPLHTVGAPARIAAMQARARAVGGLALAGNAQGGIGIPDCIRSGEVAAREVMRAQGFRR